MHIIVSTKLLNFKKKAYPEVRKKPPNIDTSDVSLITEVQACKQYLGPD